MKIMIFSSYAPTLIIYREDMMAEMISAGHEVIAAAPEPKAEWEYKFGELGIKYVSINGLDRTGINPIRDIIGFFSILKAILKEKPDKVFTYQAKTIIYGCIAAKLAGIKGIYILMGGLGSVFRSEKKEDLIRSILKIEYKIAFNCCDNAFFQNKDDSREMLKCGLVKEKQIVMINGSGINLSKFTPKAIPESPVFLFIGRIIKDKGVMEYIKAAKLVKKKYPNAKIQILGQFDTNPTAINEEEIQRYVHDGSIEYLGTAEDVRPFLEKCSVYVLPSYHEGTPKSILEAMAMGRPIITTDAPGCRETVVDSINGFLVPVKNVEVLAEKMIWMIEHKEEANLMGEESLRICKEKFDVKKVNRVILDTMKLLG